MKQEKGKVTLKLDKDVASKIALCLLEPFDGRPIEEFLTILDAFITATLAIAAQMKEECHSSAEDAVERMMLDKLCRCGKGIKMNFSKYINLPNDDEQQEE